MDQNLINTLGGIVLCFGAWWCRNVWKQLEDSRKREAEKASRDAIRDSEIMSKLDSIKLLVVGDYAKKEELMHVKAGIEEKLGRIEKLELTMAQEYVNKTDFNAVIAALFAKLDRSDEKLDSLIQKLNDKADK